MILKEGRRLSYCEYGIETGTPVFYFHGFPGSHLDVNIFSGHSHAKQLNIRLISIDGPGYGDSDFQAERALLKWPDDIAELADSLDINKFSLLGYSGGGPYVLATVYRMPDRIEKAAIVSGMGPYSAPKSKKGTSMLIPKLSGFFQTIILKNIKNNLLKDPEKFFIRMDKSLPECDCKFLQQNEVKEGFIKLLLLALKQGHKGAKQDARIYKHNWDFELSKVRHNIYYWHGKEDRNVKIETARYMSEQLPNCVFNSYPEEGHISLICNHISEIMGLFVKNKLA